MNCEEITLEIPNFNVWKYPCDSGRLSEKEIHEDLSAIEGDIINYTVSVRDIAGHIDTRSVTGLEVDTTPSFIKRFDWW